MELLVCGEGCSFDMASACFAGLLSSSVLTTCWKILRIWVSVFVLLSGSAHHEKSNVWSLATLLIAVVREKIVGRFPFYTSVQCMSESSPWLSVAWKHATCFRWASGVGSFVGYPPQCAEAPWLGAVWAWFDDQTSVNVETRFLEATLDSRAPDGKWSGSGQKTVESYSEIFGISKGQVLIQEGIFQHRSGGRGSPEVCLCRRTCERHGAGSVEPPTELELDVAAGSAHDPAPACAELGSGSQASFYLTQRRSHVRALPDAHSSP